MSNAEISRLESGKHKSPSIWILDQICKELDIWPSELTKGLTTSVINNNNNELVLCEVDDLSKMDGYSEEEDVLFEDEEEGEYSELLTFVIYPVGYDKEIIVRGEGYRYEDGTLCIWRGMRVAGKFNSDNITGFQILWKGEDYA